MGSPAFGQPPAAPLSAGGRKSRSGPASPNVRPAVQTYHWTYACKYRTARTLPWSDDSARRHPRATPPRRPIGEAPRPAGPRGLSVASRKPDPVVGDHPSGLPVAGQLVRPKPGSLGRATLKRSPIWSCTGRGLPSRPVTRTAGELLPHRFTLTRTPRKGPLAVCSLLRFPSGFPGWPLASALLYGVRTFLDGDLASCEQTRDATPPRPPGLPSECTTEAGSSDAGPSPEGQPPDRTQRRMRMRARRSSRCRRTIPRFTEGGGHKAIRGLRSTGTGRVARSAAGAVSPARRG